MKKQTILILFLVLCAISASAAPVGKSKAQAIAASFFQKSSMKAKVKGATVMLSKEYASSKDAPTAFYAFSRGENVVFVSADDEMPAILGYSDRTDLDNLPPAMEYMLDYYARLTDAVRRGEIPAPKLYASPAAVEPLCKTIWDQTEPFCSLSPEYQGEKTPNGCASTAFAQVMKYHEWPTKPSGKTETYKTGQEINPNNNRDDQKAPELDIPSVDLSTHTYNWADMINDYTGTYTEVQGKAVAQLCYDIAVASRMEFAPNSMGGSGTSVQYVAEAMRTNFGYNKGVYVDFSRFYTEEEWVAKLKNEISQKRPLPYGGQDARTKAGHCFVIDGYNAEGLFHVNWGWGGEYNDYFLITSLNPDDKGIGGGSGVDGFSDNQSTVFGLIPDRDGKSVASENFRFEYDNCLGIKGTTPNDIILSGFRNLSMDTFQGDVVVQIVDKEGKVLAEQAVLRDFTYKSMKKDGVVASLKEFDFSSFADGIYYIDLFVVSEATGIRYHVRNVEEKTRILIHDGKNNGLYRQGQEIVSGDILSCEYGGETDYGNVLLKVKAQITNYDNTKFVHDQINKVIGLYGVFYDPNYDSDTEAYFGDGLFYYYEDFEAGETKTFDTDMEMAYWGFEMKDLVLRLQLGYKDGSPFVEKEYPMKDLMATAINDVKADKELNAPIFNTKGQRVNPNAVQGIFIRNGKKIVKK